MMDNLRKWKMIIINACLTCLAEVKSVDHLFINFQLALALWILAKGPFVCIEYVEIHSMKCLKMKTKSGYIKMTIK